MRLQLTGLWRNPDFVKLWAGQTVSVFGTLLGALQFTAVLVLNATPFQMALLIAAGTASGLVAGLFAGVWVDRLRRRPILIVADIGRALLIGSIPLAYFLGLLRIEQLYVVAFFGGALTILFDVAYGSYLPSIVQRKDLIKANSKLSASASVVEATAFSVGGWIAQLFTAITAATIDAFSFLISALSLAWIRRPESPQAPAAEQRNTLREIADGLKVVKSSPILRAVAGSAVAEGLAHGIIGAVILLFVIRQLGIQPGVFGMIAALGGISSVAGSVFAGRVTARFGLGRAMAFGMLLSGLSALFIPLAQGPLIVAAALLVMQQLLGDGAHTVYDINQMSLRQSITPDRLLGRVNASIRILSQGAMLIGALVAGVIAGPIGLRWTLAAGACCLVLGGVWLALSRIGKFKELPAQSLDPPSIIH